MLGFAADPRQCGAIRSAASSEGIPLAYRRMAVEGIRDGFCLNPAEIVDGPAAARALAVNEIANGLGARPDDPDSAESAKGSRKLLGHGPGRVIARLRHCAAVGR